MPSKKKTENPTPPAGPAAEQLSIDRFNVSDVVRALEMLWNREVRRRHPELPPAVIVVASGAEGQKLARWGHWGDARWNVGRVATADLARGAGRVGEVLIAGERLAHGARAVLGTLLHEAAHAIATARGLQDTSRQGRYHNDRYRVLALEVGLTCEKDDRYGWTLTDVPDATAEAYSDALGTLAVVLRGHRESVGGPAGKKKGGGNRPVYACQCPDPRKIRMAPKTAEAGHVFCGVCGEAFQLGEAA